jgi:hypothetical protein
VIVAEVQMPLFGDPRAPSSRREVRHPVVRDVEYCRFPRVCADQRPRIGFTRDLSASGLCLRVDVSEPVGSLLRVVVRGIDGAPRREAIARVAWTGPGLDGGHWMGLTLVESGAARAVRIRALRRTAAPVEVA